MTVVDQRSTRRRDPRQRRGGVPDRRASSDCNSCWSAWTDNADRIRNCAWSPTTNRRGDQPTAINELIEGLEDGLAHQTLLGVTGSGKTFAIAKVVEAVQRPTLVLAPNKTLAAQLYGEFREFFPDNAVRVLRPPTTTTINPRPTSPRPTPTSRRDASINAHIEQMAAVGHARR